MASRRGKQNLTAEQDCTFLQLLQLGSYPCTGRAQARAVAVGHLHAQGAQSGVPRRG